MLSGFMRLKTCSVKCILEGHCYSWDQYLGLNQRSSQDVLSQLRAALTHGNACTSFLSRNISFSLVNMRENRCCTLCFYLAAATVVFTMRSDYSRLRFLLQHLQRKAYFLINVCDNTDNCSLLSSHLICL